MNKLLNWLDHRTGYRAVVHDALYENIPGGARWRYVWGSTLVLAFATQMITGIFLWLVYSPNDQTAWESVYYLQYEMSGGWLLRGIHHFMAQAMVVLLVIHLLQVVIDGAYRAPREVNFWLGLILMFITLALSLTGYLLPWDQKGYWATKVATSLVGLVPVIGEPLQKVIVGGNEYGHQTLTRFFALHAGVLPGLLIFFLVLHIALFRRHGLHATRPEAKPDAKFWPGQVARDAVVCLAVMAAVVFFAVWHRGAELGAPADPTSAFDARPEWYFLYLFQFLKYFPGELEVIGAHVVPALVVLVLFLMPIIGRWKLGHRFNVAFLLGLILGAGFLTAQALNDDYYSRWHTYDENKFSEGSEEQKKYKKKFATSEQYLAAVAQAKQDAERAIALAEHGIPPTGALTMLRSDPKTQGPKLFAQNCAVCHQYAARDGSELEWNLPVDNPSAPNLYRFGTAQWIAGILDPQKIKSKHYFGYTNDGQQSPFLDGDMVSYVTDELYTDLEGESRKKLLREVDAVVAALAAGANLPKATETEDDSEQHKALVARGNKLLLQEEIEGYEATGRITCTDCHKYQSAGDLGSAPDLTGYASRQWMIDFIQNPSHERFYPDTNDRMPAFHGQLNEESIGLIVDWIRGDWVRVNSETKESDEGAAEESGSAEDVEETEAD